MMSGRSSRYPFTASQWQELEHQALIFKYMASGMPIPSELILHMRRSYLLDSMTTTPTLAFAPQPSLGWSCYQMGFGRKAEDPEPGRCRRTDGKKWRCAKEAYPDSKYCERHMHRGKNRSRKPVEMSLTTNSTPTPTPIHHASSSSHPPPLSISLPESYHLLYPYPSSSRPPGTIGFQHLQNNTNNFHLDAQSYSTDKEHRYCHGVKDVDEYTFFSPSGSERGSSWEFRPLGMSSLGEPKQSSSLHHNSFTLTTDLSKEEEEKQQHCFVLGADFKLGKSMKEEREEETQRPLRHFFDEWPQKTKDSWTDLEGGHSNSKTQLSISIPMAYHDFPVTGSRYGNGLELSDSHASSP